MSVIHLIKETQFMYFSLLFSFYYWKQANKKREKTLITLILNMKSIWSFSETHLQTCCRRSMCLKHRNLPKIKVLNFTSEQKQHKIFSEWENRRQNITNIKKCITNLQTMNSFIYSQIDFNLYLLNQNRKNTKQNNKQVVHALNWRLKSCTLQFSDT